MTGANYEETYEQRAERAAIEVPIEGLRVLVGEDGVWLAFDSPDGQQHALIHAELIAGRYNGIAGDAVLAWAEGRQRAATQAGA